MQEHDAFLEALRKPGPDPGGGAAAAHGALMAVCLLEKVVMLEKTRAGSTRDARAWWGETLEHLRSLGEEAVRLRAEDVEAYRRLAGAFKGPSGEGFRDGAAEAASRVPSTIMETAAEALHTAAAVGRRCAHHLRADVAVAVEFLGAAVQAAFWIARANALLIRDPQRQAQLQGKLRDRLEAGAHALEAARKEFAQHGEARCG